MASKVFLDANLLLDAYSDRVRIEVAKQILMAANAGLVKAFTTPAVLHIFDYFVSKAQSAGWTRKLLVSLLEDVTVIDLNHSTAKQALASGI